MDKHSRRAKAHYRLVTAQEKAARRVESNTLRAQSMLYYIQGKEIPPGTPISSTSQRSLLVLYPR